jgi:hypothetical protein
MTVRLQPFRKPGTLAAAGMYPAGRPGAQVLLSVLPFAVMGAVAAADVLAGPELGCCPCCRWALRWQRCHCDRCTQRWLAG